MTGCRLLVVFVAAALATTAGLPKAALAQTRPDALQQQDEQLPAYRPPPRGAPGGRVGGASRGTFRPAAPLPTIELLAPRDHTGLTADPAPSLYFFVSGPVLWPTRFTMSAPGRPDPVLDVPIAAPAAAGIYRLDVAQYGVRLESGVLYTWSVSAVLDPARHARDIVASATLLEGDPDKAAADAAGAISPARRAVLCAQAGLWYDAVAAAVAAEPSDRHAALEALMNEEALAEPAAYDRQAAAVPAR